MPAAHSLLRTAEAAPGCVAAKREVGLDPERLLRNYFEQTTEFAFLLLNPEGTIIWCNATAERIFGCAAGELVGRAVHRLFVPEDVQEGIPEYELHVAARSSDVMDDRWMMRADGGRFWASGATTALHEANGSLAGFGKLLRNATDAKEQIETLRNRVAALLQADEHKNIFLSTLSHELRNPLAPLTNALQLIRMAAPAHDALQYPIKLIDRQVEFIRRLVDDLLDVTRISTGKVQLDLIAVDLRVVLQRAAESAQPLMTQHRHTLTQHILHAPIPVHADPVRLEQVFVNLLSNASKYTPEGGVIELRATRERDEAIVQVRDNGIGISADMLPHIFDLFTQVAAASPQAQGGLGIGLALVKNLVELHRGSVQVRSEGLGQGTEFTVRLPLAR
jgi:PAS domain S-box-containing protein